jgi:hypothetical protein
MSRHDSPSPHVRFTPESGVGQALSYAGILCLGINGDRIFVTPRRLGKANDRGHVLCEDDKEVIA